MDKEKFSEMKNEWLGQNGNKIEGKLKEVNKKLLGIRDKCRVNIPEEAQRKAWWNPNIKAEMKKRKELSREHRKSRGMGVERRASWEKYKEQKDKVQEMVQSQIVEENQQIFRGILGAPKGKRQKMFWEYINGNAGREESIAKQFQGIKKEHMNEAVEKLFLTHGKDDGEEERESEEKRVDSEIRTTFCEIKRIIGSMNGKTSPGVDGVTIELIKSMGDEYIWYLVGEFNEIFAGEGLPEEWRVGRVAVLPKEGVDNSKLENRRPLTINSVLYRILCRYIRVAYKKS